MAPEASDPPPPGPRATGAPWSAADQADYEEGWALYTERRYFEAHESWERAWRRCADPERRFVQGLILLTAACHLLFTVGRRPGGRQNLRKAERALSEVPARCLGEDVTGLRAAIARLLAAVPEAGDGAETALVSELAPGRPSACAR